MKKTGTADGELVESRPATRRRGGSGDEIGRNGWDGVGALLLHADGADQGGEFGADTGKASPISRIIIELEENIENDIVGNL